MFRQSITETENSECSTEEKTGNRYGIFKPAAAFYFNKRRQESPSTPVAELKKQAIDYANKYAKLSKKG